LIVHPAGQLLADLQQFAVVHEKDPAALELGAFEYANGLINYAPGARYDLAGPR